MIKTSEEAERDITLAVADLMLAAARTAPKGCGADNVRALALEGSDKDKLASAMREIGDECGQDFFDRDAENVDDSHCVVIIGTEAAPIGLESCGICGFADCAQCVRAGSHCAFNVTDLGIAVGSAASVACDHRIDNRVLYSAGKAAVRLNLLGDNVKLCYAIPLSTGSKNIFFDREC